MNGIYLLLIFIALFGFLPLCIIVYKSSYAKKIRRSGMPANARIYRVHRARTGKILTDMVAYTYYGTERKQFYGSFVTGDIGRYQENQVIQVYFDPAKPKYSTVDGAWGSPFYIIFGLLIALGVLYMVYRLFLDIRSGAI